jgi:predicted secreted hydrolase
VTVATTGTIRGSGATLLVAVLAIVAVLGVGLAVVTRLGGDRPAMTTVGGTLSVSEALATTSAEGFERAVAPRAFTFPADHGPHPTFRTEWWYWTGNVKTDGPGGVGRRFGFQLTFFRTAFGLTMAPRGSAWGMRDAYLGHLALSDIDARRFYARDRWARGALDLAGATANPFEVWVGDWVATSRPSGGWPLRLHAEEKNFGIDLALSPGKPPVLQGEQGLSRKSAQPGNASYYYSLTRMPVSGALRLGSVALPVEGLAWMDREWSTSALGPNQVGWDWFALQLDDGRELMLYRLRQRDGGIAPQSGGTLVAADGTTRALAREQVEVLATDEWTSPRGGTRYPARWHLRVPSAGLDVVVTPLLQDQELDLAIRYWEGAVRVEGTADGRAVGGAGYVELVGYASSPGGFAEAVRQ